MKCILWVLSTFKCIGKPLKMEISARIEQMQQNLICICTKIILIYSKKKKKNPTFIQHASLKR